MYTKNFLNHVPIYPVQEELGDYEVNPDCVSLRLYRCWDSKALISEDDTSRAINVRSEGAITASQAMPLM